MPYCLLQMFRNDCDTGDRNIVRARGDRQREGNSVFWTQQASCIKELTAVLIACTGPI